MEQHKSVSRLGIFVFYDSKGIVDDYIFYLLNDLINNLSELQIVCNGIISNSGLDKLKQYSDKIFIRENFGYDVVAWKKALLEYNDREYLMSFDEILLFNDSFFGPLYPFNEVFSKMSNYDYDFWGLSAHPEAKQEPNEIYGYVPAFIQSYFVVFRKKLIDSEVFYKHWEELPDDLNFKKAVQLHEVIFTKKFADLGFTWGALVDYSKMDNRKQYGMCFNTFMPYEAIRTFQLPIIRRKLFSFSQKEILQQGMGNELPMAFEYIKNKTSYPVKFIWQNILRLYDFYDIKNALKLNYVLSTNTPTVSEKFSKYAVCVIVHLYYIDKLDEALRYLKNIPPGIDLIITTNSEDKKYAISTELSLNSIPCKTIIVAKNRGREQGALFVGCKEYIKQYDFICFLHDKKTLAAGSLMNYASGSSFQNILFENLLTSTGYIYNILELFDHDTNLGVLVPPAPLHSIYSQSIGMEWTTNFHEEEKFLKKISVNVAIHEDKPPFTLGTAFWCRVKALNKLFFYDWNYNDFPKEPVHIDGTIMHALERSFEYIAQEGGYYTASVMNNKYASIVIQDYCIITSTLMGACRSATNNIATYDVYPDILKYKLTHTEHLSKESVFVEINKHSLSNQCCLFDYLWYYRVYLEDVLPDSNPIDHYFEIGWKKGYNPSYSFDNNSYLSQHPDLLKINMNPLIHFLLNGSGKVTDMPELSDYDLIKGSLLFSKQWYLDNYKDVADAGVDPLKHYIEFGWKEYRNPSPLFNTQAYIIDNPDVLTKNITPLVHYLRYGKYNGKHVVFVDNISDEQILKYSGLFNEEYYVKSYAIYDNPLQHYLEIGWKEGYNPSKLFDTKRYLEAYPDVKVAGLNPVIHFVKYGQFENRNSYYVQEQCESARRHKLFNFITKSKFSR